MPLPRRSGTLLFILAVFVWFGSSKAPPESEARKRLKQDPRALLTNPLLGLALLVSRDGDDRLYYNYASLIVGGAPDLDYLSTKEQGDPATARARLERAITPSGPRLPYRDFPVEYPPVPLALMLLPRLLVTDYYPYRMLFTALTAALFFAGGWLAIGLSRKIAPNLGDEAPPTIWRRLGWLLLVIGPIFVQRFDVLPATLLIATLAALARKRDGLAGLALGLAILSKLYPLLVALPLAGFFLGARQVRRVAVVAGATLATMAAVAAPFLALTPEAFLRSNALYGARPFHFESTWGSLLLALRGAGTLEATFGSVNVASPAWLLQLASLVLGAGLVALGWGAWRSGRACAATEGPAPTLALLGWALATLLFVLSVSKVLSPQFMIWLVPLAALFRGPTGRRIFAGALLATGLTSLFYPPLHGLARAGHPLAVAVLLARNAVLIALAVYVTRQASRPDAVAPPAPRPTASPADPSRAATAPS